MKSFISFISSLALIYYFLFPQQALAQVNDPSDQMVFLRDPELTVRYQAEQTEIQRIQALIDYNGKIKRSWRVVTAYTSTKDQTDGSPYVTASGAHVSEGIVAANFLSFGTKLRIPELFGDRIFVVEDRMNPRFGQRVDVWFTSRHEAQDFGVRQAQIEVLPD